MAVLLLGQTAMAGVMVESSRVVFSAADPERSLIISNTNDYPVIVQAWIDHGAPEGTPEKATDSPVMPLPGIFRLEPGEKKSLRLLATQLKQPTDRESLYWLNLYEIPPKDAHLPPGMSAVKVAVRLQLKMFYRPENLKPSPDDVASKQTFSVDARAVKVNNPTPYYATFSAAEVSDGTHSYPLPIGMLAPFSSKTLVLNTPGMSQPKSLHYILINDDGNGVEKRKAL